MVEFALTLPVLLTVLFGVVDLSRAIQFDNVLTHISREGANLAARAKDIQPQQIIAALGSTAAPLDMATDGMIYISEIEGDADGSGRIISQYRAGRGNTALASRLWTCPAWNADAKCQVPGRRQTVALAGALRAGERVWAVETRYDYPLLTRYLFRTGPDLYAITVM